ncbi:MAG: hypothetical protein U0610_07815 [bacterium]
MRTVVQGALIATAVASLFASGTALAAGEPAASAKVKCLGINACKGQSLCSAPGLSHSCAGHNECKGKGWIYAASADECTGKGGRLVGTAGAK